MYERTKFSPKPFSLNSPTKVLDINVRPTLKYNWDKYGLWECEANDNPITFVPVYEYYNVIDKKDETYNETLKDSSFSITNVANSANEMIEFMVPERKMSWFSTCANGGCEVHSVTSYSCRVEADEPVAYSILRRNADSTLNVVVAETDNTVETTVNKDLPGTYFIKLRKQSPSPAHIHVKVIATRLVHISTTEQRRRLVGYRPVAEKSFQNIDFVTNNLLLKVSDDDCGCK